MAQPLVSIGLPVYNGEQYLSEALDCLLAQDQPDFELVICDNASTDSTLQICEQYARRDPRIRIERSPRNLGAIHNFNKAFRCCTGKYFMWAAHDDQWEPSYVGRCIQELEKHPEAILAASDLTFIDERGGEIETLWSFDATVGMDVVQRAKGIFQKWGWYAIYGVIRSEALRKTGLTQNVVGPDVLLLLQLSLMGPFAKVPEKLFRYRFFQDKTIEQSLQAMNPASSGSSRKQFNTDLARDLWHAIRVADLPLELRDEIHASFLEILAAQNLTWRNAIIAENPFSIYPRAADQVPRGLLKRHLYRLLSKASALGTPLFPPSHPSLRPEPATLLYPERSRIEQPVRWLAPIFNPSGYASEAINFILPLAPRLDLGICHQNNIYSEKFVSGLAEQDRATLFSLRDRFAKLRGGIVISHQPANGFVHLADGEYHIGRSMYETDRIPQEWVAKCNLMDEVWVPSEFNRQTFAGSGVLPEKLIVIPGAVDAHEFDPARHSPLLLPNKAARNFLSIFEWSSRKGWDVLLAAYLREFSAEDDVCLWLRTYLMSRPDGDPTQEIWRRIRAFASGLNLGAKPWPRIEILSEQTATADLPRLYKAVDCLVAPARGEGWGRPHHEAMMMGVPVIATNWSGNTQFMNGENSYLLDYELEEAVRIEPELWHYKGHRWARASETHLRQLMRRVVENPAEARAKGSIARAQIVAQYSREAVSKIVLERLVEIQRKQSTPACPAVVVRKTAAAQDAAVQENLSVRWEGTFQDFGSLAHVNRELTAALAERKVNVARVDLARSGQSCGDTSVTVRHAWPPDWSLPRESAWVQIQPWEFGALPMEWVEKGRQVDEFWVYTEHLRQVYIGSGVPPEKVHVVPLGIDPSRFSPTAEPLELPTSKKFKFLFVGGTIFRKGPDLLLQAFLDSFTASDDVCLVIKSFGANSVYANQGCEQQILAARLRPDAPEILLLDRELQPEEMPGLYTACDCLVHPYRGEGFGLPVLEAMACGLPVVVTAGGATDDFATDEFAYRIPATRENLGRSAGGFRLSRNGWMLEPDLVVLSEILMGVFRHPEAIRAKGALAARHVREEWTWSRAAARAEARLSRLLTKRANEKAHTAQRRARKLESIPMAAVGRIGNLSEAQDLLAAREHAKAWESASRALAVRPFHPEAWLLMARVALACKDLVKARECCRTALRLAPQMQAAREFSRELAPAKDGQVDHALVLPPISSGTRLSVCMIVKNEERFLEKALASIKAVAHEIVVVDTGSTDRTIEIAQSFGARIESFAWCDDFSAARNAALAHATGDWVLCLDADEELPPQSVGSLKRDLADRQAMCYRIPLVEKGQESEGRSHIPRLFRNAPGAFFFGRVHEQVFFTLEKSRKEWGLENKFGSAQFIHHGYSAEVVNARAKTARNLHLLELAIEEWPNEPNLLINHALELTRSGRLDEAVEQALWACEIYAGIPPREHAAEFREFLLTRAAQILLAAKCHQKIADLFQGAIARIAPLTASHHFLAGLAYLEMRKHEEAAHHFTQCLKKRSGPTLSPAIKDVLKSGPNHCLGICLARLNRPVEAEKALRAGLQEDPSSTGLRVELGRLLRSQNQILPALQMLCEGAAFAASDLAFWRLGGELSLSEPEFLEFALDWTAEALKNAGEDLVLIAHRAEALTLAGQPAAALPLWERTPHRQNVRCAAALLLCQTICSGPQAHPGFDEAELSREFLGWYRRLIATNAEAALNVVHQRLRKLAPHVPTAISLVQSALQTAESESALAPAR